MDVAQLGPCDFRTRLSTTDRNTDRILNDLQGAESKRLVAGRRMLEELKELSGAERGWQRNY
jgi:hypothetical protein